MVDTSLLVSESIFVKIPNGSSASSPNYHDSIEELRDELKSLSWDQLISLDLEEPSPNSLDESKPGRVRMTKSEALNLLNIAATLLQRNIRRYFQQQKYHNFLLAYKAAVKIQSVWRGYRTRNLDVRVLQIKHNYIISKLQERICTMNENYENKIGNINKDKHLLIQIVSLLSNEVDNLKDLSSSFKFVKGDVVSSIEMKGSDPTTPTNDQTAFYINNPHLSQTDSGVNVNLSSSCDVNDDKEVKVNMCNEKEHSSDISVNSNTSEQSPVISFEGSGNNTIVLCKPKRCTTPTNISVNRSKANHSMVSASIALDDDVNNPLDLVDGIKAVSINDIILCDGSEGKMHDHEACSETDKLEIIVNDFMQADSVEFLNDSLQVDDCSDNGEHDDGTQFLYDSLQRDSISINPIEADSLQFIHDSLQVD